MRLASQAFGFLTAASSIAGTVLWVSISGTDNREDALWLPWTLVAFNILIPIISCKFLASVQNTAATLIFFVSCYIIALNEVSDMFFTRPFSFNPSSIAVVTISFLITLVGYRYLLKSIAGVEDLGVVDSIANRMRYCAAAVVETFRDLVKTTLEAARNVVEAALNAVGRFLARFDSFMDAFSGAIPLSPTTSPITPPTTTAPTATPTTATPPAISFQLQENCECLPLPYYLMSHPHQESPPPYSLVNDPVKPLEKCSS